jgi:hypothetical protein
MTARVPAAGPQPAAVSHPRTKAHTPGEFVTSSALPGRRGTSHNGGNTSAPGDRQVTITTPARAHPYLITGHRGGSTNYLRPPGSAGPLPGGGEPLRRPGCPGPPVSPATAIGHPGLRYRGAVRRGDGTAGAPGRTGHAVRPSGGLASGQPPGRSSGPHITLILSRTGSSDTSSGSQQRHLSRRGHPCPWRQPRTGLPFHPSRSYATPFRSRCSVSIAPRKIGFPEFTASLQHYLAGAVHPKTYAMIAKVLGVDEI